MFNRISRAAAGALLVLSAGACAGAGGGIGDILGAVLGGGAGGQQVAGVIAGVDTRNRVIGLQQQNGQTVELQFDDNTQVIYQNQRYAVSALERGDQVVARVQATNNNGYYTDSIQVTRSVSEGSGGSANLQSFQGTVRQIDRQAAMFSISSGTQTLTVTMPYQPTQDDAYRFNNLRVGDAVRFYGVYVSSTRVELRQFY
jgi:hypothetical protein